MKEIEYTDECNTTWSSAVRRVLYNESTKEMFVFFPAHDVPAGYKDVEPVDYTDFINTASIGRWYTYNVKGHFSGVDTGDVYFRKVDPKPVPAPEPEPEVETYNAGQIETYEVTYVHTTTTRVSAVSFEDAISSVSDVEEGIRVLGVKIVE